MQAHFLNGRPAGILHRSGRMEQARRVEHLVAYDCIEHAERTE
jgi:hypothetical protein